MKSALLLIPLVGCIAPESLDTGAEVTVRVLPVSGSSFTSESTNPSITLRTTETSYMLTYDIEFTPGEREQDSMFDRFDVTRVESTAAVPDVTIPMLVFEKESEFSRTFEGKTTIVLPATAKSKAMTITARGFDSRGLSSNLVQFDVALK